MRKTHDDNARPGRPTAVIVGLEANGLGVARSLARHRIPCIALAGPSWNPCFQTNTCEVVRGSGWTSESMIRDLLSIGGRLTHKAPLLLTKDQAVLWVSDAREELSEFFEIALPEKRTVDLLMSKVEFVRLAQSEGWPVPHTWMIETKDELLSCLPEVSYPCILKPQVKNDMFRAHSPRKAFRASSQVDLLEAYDMVSEWEKEVVIQEWIEGADERIGFCLSYCNREAVPLALFSGRKLIQWPVGWGNTAVCEPAPEEWKEAMGALTKRVWERVGYKGLGSVEYKIRPGTNTPVIMEPTVGRTDFQSELAVLNGVNIPAIAYCDLAHLPVPSEIAPIRAIKLIDGPSHLRAARVFIAQSSEMGTLKWLRARQGSKRYMILRRGDYGPFFCSLYSSARSMIGNLLERLLGKQLKHKLVGMLTR